MFLSTMVVSMTINFYQYVDISIDFTSTQRGDKSKFLLYHKNNR